jgi:hypothetical protein
MTLIETASDCSAVADPNATGAGPTDIPNKNVQNCDLK